MMTQRLNSTNLISNTKSFFTTMEVFDFFFTVGIVCCFVAVVLLLAAHGLYYKTSMSYHKLRFMAVFAYYLGLLGLTIAIISSIIELFLI